MCARSFFRVCVPIDQHFETVDLFRLFFFSINQIMQERCGRTKRLRYQDMTAFDMPNNYPHDLAAVNWRGSSNLFIFISICTYIKVLAHERLRGCLVDLGYRPLVQ